MHLRILIDFLKDRSGNLSIFGFFMVFVSVSSMAICFNYSYSSFKKQIIDSAIEITKIAGDTYIRNNPNMKDSDKEAYINSFFSNNINKNWPNANDIILNIALPSSRNNNTLKLSASYSLASLLLFHSPQRLKVVSQEKTKEVSKDKSVEIVFVVDVTNHPYIDHYRYNIHRYESHLTYFRSAYKTFISDLYKYLEKNYPSQKPAAIAKVGFVPFANFVKVDPELYNEYNAPQWLDIKGLGPKHFEPISSAGIDYEEVVLFRNNIYDFLKDVHGRDRNFSRFVVYDILATNGTIYHWNGCLEARPYPLNMNDSIADPASPETLFLPSFFPDAPGDAKKNPFRSSDYLADTEITYMNKTLYRNHMLQYVRSPLYETTHTHKRDKAPADEDYGPNLGCPNTLEPIIPLRGINFEATGMNQITPVTSYTRDFIEGFAWGWRVLSDTEPFTEGFSYKKEGNKKILIMLSTGDLHFSFRDYYGAHGFFETNEGFPDNLDRNATSDLCNAIKKSGIDIYSIYFGYPDSQRDIPYVLNQCSSSLKDKKSKGSYVSYKEKDVSRAFKDIYGHVIDHFETPNN